MPAMPAEWIGEKAWGELFRLSQLPNFSGFLESFEKNITYYKKMYDSTTPHELQDFPDGWDEKLSLFQKLLVLRVIRPDKVIPGVMDFVKESMGAQFIDPPPFDLGLVYNDTTSTTPIIFVL